MNVLAAPVSLHPQESEGQTGERWATWFPGSDKPDMFLKPLSSPVALAARQAVLARAVGGGRPLAEPSVLGPSRLALLQASLGPGQLLGPILVFCSL